VCVADVGAQVSSLIADMAGQPTTRILDSLRSLERKTGLVFTFFKASVYAMVVRLVFCGG
jgi:DASH complex subunit DAD3